MRRLVCLAVLLAVPAALSARQPPDSCVWHRWLFFRGSGGSPFQQSTAQNGRDVLTLTEGQPPEASIENVCQPRKVRVRHRKNGTDRVKVVWHDCVLSWPGQVEGPDHVLLGRVKWKGTINAGCTSMFGYLTARGIGFHHAPSEWHRSYCGDGIRDPGLGEECDFGRSADDVYHECPGLAPQCIRCLCYQ